jgi:hypothetical protein
MHNGKRASSYATAGNFSEWLIGVRELSPGGLHPFASDALKVAQSEDGWIVENELLQPRLVSVELRERFHRGDRQFALLAGRWMNVYVGLLHLCGRDFGGFVHAAALELFVRADTSGLDHFCTRDSRSAGISDWVRVSSWN